MPRNSYTEALAATLCERVARGQALSAAARACGLTPSTVHGWYHRYAGFRVRLDAARDRAAGLTGKAVRPVGSSTIGRPAKYRPETANEIAGRHATGEQLSDIARAVGVAYGTILNWQALHPEFRDMMDEARRSYAHVAVEQALDILDDDSKDLIEQPDGRLTANTARVRRDQQRAAMRWRLAERFNPDAYGKTGARRPPQITINIDADKLERIRRVSESTLAAIGGRIVQEGSEERGS